MTRSVVLAAGGTGGHLFPALALGGEMMRRGWRAVLMTDARARSFQRLMEDSACAPGAPDSPDSPGSPGSPDSPDSASSPGSTHGMETHVLPSATLPPRRLASAPGAVLAILRGTGRAFMLMGRLRPAVVAGFGGYPSLPPVLAALLRRVPVCLHDQGAVLGRVNRRAAPWATAVASGFAASGEAAHPAHPARLVVTGNPVRPEIAAAARHPYAPPAAAGPVRLLVFGGSQGARILGRVMPEALGRLPLRLRRRLQLVQQCRPEDLEQARAGYAASGIAAQLAGFFPDMPAHLARAHLVVARAGGITVSELALMGRPAVLVPFPGLRHGEQDANAAALAAAGGAWVLPESRFQPAAAAALLGQLLDQPARLAAAAAAARACGRPDATRRLADLVEACAGPAPHPEQAP